MHLPVLLKEVIGFLKPQPGKRYIDATIGEAGHTKALVDAGAEVLGIDRDPDVIQRLHSTGSRFQAITGDFAKLEDVAIENGFDEVDGILLDLGIGSFQLDDPKRGFAFQKEGQLDMRMNQNDRLTAAEIVNGYPEKELLKIFRGYGEEKRFSRRIVQTILFVRKSEKIKTTTELFELIKKALPRQFRNRAGDVARRIFQSLRIEVNDELQNLRDGLPQSLKLLKNRGRLVIISFHSLEDRIVKNFFKEVSKDCICPPEFPVCRCAAQASLKILTQKPIIPSMEEIKINPRSKSAKLRAAEKL